MSIMHRVLLISIILFTFRGKDFRTAFAKIGRLRALTNAPFMALTATASPDVQDSISQSLHLVNPVVVSCSLNRPNIYLSASGMKGYHESPVMSIVNVFLLYMTVFLFKLTLPALLSG